MVFKDNDFKLEINLKKLMQMEAAYKKIREDILPEVQKYLEDIRKIYSNFIYNDAE